MERRIESVGSVSMKVMMDNGEEYIMEIFADTNRSPDMLISMTSDFMARNTMNISIPYKGIAFTAIEKRDEDIGESDMPACSLLG